VIKILPSLLIEPRLNIKYGFNWAGKNEHFSKVSREAFFILPIKYLKKFY
jgi:hypothetical protein